MSYRVRPLDAGQWLAGLSDFETHSLFNTPELSEAVARVYGDESLYLELSAGDSRVGLINLVVARGIVSVAHAPMGRMWARPTLLLAPDQGANAWIATILEFLSGLRIDLLSLYSYEDLCAPEHCLKTLSTDLISLAGREEERFKLLHKRNRYNVRSAMQLGVAVRTGQNEADASAFWMMYTSMWRRDGLARRILRRRHSRDYFRQILGLRNSELLLAEVGGRAVAGTIITWDTHTAYYQHNVSIESARSLQANHLILWAAMNRASQRGLRHFDLGGIPRADQGNYFKRGWGPGTSLEFKWYLIPLTRRGVVCQRLARAVYGHSEPLHV